MMIGQSAARIFSGLESNPPWNRIEIEGIDAWTSGEVTECSVPHGAMHRGAAGHKTWAEPRDNSPTSRGEGSAVGAADIPLCLSSMADVICTPTPCLPLLPPPLLPVLTRRPFPFLAASNYTVGEVIYKATPARARARLISVTSLRGGMRANSRSPITIPRD